MISEESLAKAGISPKAYSELSDSERQVVDEVLKEIASGSLDSYDQLYYSDYDEIPVDFLTFITDDRYLGKSTRHGQFLYPFWRNEIPRIFSANVSEVALSGSIGVGKSTAAVLALIYHLYRTMCMKNPQEFFSLAPGTKIEYAFLNNTLGSSYGVAYSAFQAFIQESPWFLKHGKIAGRNYPEYVPEKGFGFVVGSKPQHTLGRAIIGAILDEVSFAPGQNISYEHSKIMDVYTNIRRRMESRFMVQGKCYGMLFLVSSKATESSFLEAYIADQVKKGYPIYVVDQPLWKIKPAAYSGKYFKVAVGNKYIQSRVEPLDLTDEMRTDWIDSATKSGLTVIDVPVEHRQAFDQNLDKALQDIAGISTSVVTKAFSVERVLKCISDKYRNPFTSDIVTIGLKDTLKLRDFFNASLIPDHVRSAPIFIHLDASLTGDRSGLSGVALVGTREVTTYGSDVDEEYVSEELLYQQVFSVGIQSPSDSEISLEKTRQFIYYLKDEVGLNIKGFSADGFQSADTRQILTTKGYKTDYISLDRTPDGYDSLRSAINDQRIVLLQGCDILVTELSELERDNMTRKYDHTAYSTKDVSDSLAGAFLNATKYKDEFIFFNPRDYDYETLNDKSNDVDRVQQEMVASILGTKLSNDIVSKLISRDEDESNQGFFNAYDSNILTL